MAQTTLLTTISRNDTYPVYTNISAPHSCGTVKILVDSTYTEQMLYELPNITINIYTESDGEKVLYTSRALTMKVPEVDNPIESILVDIPTTCILAVIPEFDDTAFEAHNEAVCTSKEGTKWTEPTETFPITIIWDDTNIYAQQGEGGGGGGSSSASDITYDNSLSGLLGTNVQDVNNIPVQRDLYSAFLISNVNESLDGFDINLCNSKYDNFLELHNLKIQELRQQKLLTNKKFLSCMGI